MKRLGLLSATVAMLIAALGASSQPAPDDTLRQLDHNLNNILTLLKDVTDQKSAQEATAKLAALDKEVNAAVELLRKSTARPSADGEKRLVEMQNRLDEIEKQVVRITANRRIAEVLDTVTATKGLANLLKESLTARAKTDVKNLEKAAAAYEIQYGVRPNSLFQLTAPPNGRPFVEKEALIDPWGRPYLYNPAGLTNRGLKPDIWSLGPAANDNTKVISNWPGGGPPATARPIDKDVDKNGKSTR
jgi:hypothetical protein